jgi:hypothetical protein
MSEPKVRRVKKIPTEVSVLFHKSFLSALSIDAVADDRMTDRAEMNAYLMRSASLDSHVEQGEPAKLFDDFVFRVRGSSTPDVRSHARSDRSMARYRHIDFAGRSRKVPMNQRDVALFDSAVLKRFSECGMRRIVFSHDQQT